MGRWLGLFALALGTWWFATAPVQSQVAPTTTAPTDPTTSDDTPAVDADQLSPLDPRLLTEAHTSGERAAAEIRTRIGELAAARIEVVATGSAAAQAELDSATGQVLARVAGLQQAGAELDQLQFSHNQVVTDYHDARQALARHAAVLYTRNPELIIANDLMRSGDLELAITRMQIIRAILDGDRRLLLQTYLAAAASDPDLATRAARVRADSAALRSLVDAEDLASDIAAEAHADEAAVRALASDFVFPVEGDHDFVDTFLAPRMVGTRYVHRHQGTDVFAEAGTPLVAVERGIVGRVGEVTLGGLRVWLIGESGTNYYYAHLSGFAPDLEPGQFVEAGTVLGYVGNTGNALSTPPHLHFQVHPGGGSAVNPHPLLRQTSPAG